MNSEHKSCTYKAEIHRVSASQRLHYHFLFSLKSARNKENTQNKGRLKRTLQSKFSCV